MALSPAFSFDHSGHLPVGWRKRLSTPGTRSLSRGPPEARLGCCHGAHGSRQREEMRAELPLTSSITLEERKRGSDDTAYQDTSHPRFPPAGLHGGGKARILAPCCLDSTVRGWLLL